MKFEATKGGPAWGPGRLGSRSLWGIERRLGTLEVDAGGNRLELANSLLEVGQFDPVSG